ncbi:hypothetical protein [Carnobacterium maltaromaticum]|uniref:hypothetical protein n=1 Tax=Carnobacterium maltaromaticum TaxID=2751 RepID=UPI00295F33AB|nr:hypothetical protein [Carnobacterium maltaromaticum]
MNRQFDIEELYSKIIPSVRKNNKDHICTALKFKEHLQKSEEELINNLEHNQISYTREYCTKEQVLLTKSDGDFLRNKMYGEWFYNSKYYSQLILKSENCCYCFIGPVDELDHFFNKDSNPELSISNVNLVPSCTKCNKNKKQDAIYLQPYFESVETYEWLDCDFDWVGFEGKPKPTFSIVHPKTMPQDMFDKLELQLPQKRLIEQMIKKSTDYISSHWDSWKLQIKSLDNVQTSHENTNTFKLIIETEFNSKKITYGINSWEYQIYKNLYTKFDEFKKKLNE